MQICGVCCNATVRSRTVQCVLPIHISYKVLSRFTCKLNLLLHFADLHSLFSQSTKIHAYLRPKFQSLASSQTMSDTWIAASPFKDSSSFWLSATLVLRAFELFDARHGKDLGMFEDTQIVLNGGSTGFCKTPIACMWYTYVYIYNYRIDNTYVY